MASPKNWVKSLAEETDPFKILASPAPDRLDGSHETVEWKRRVKELADDTFPDAQDVTFHVVTHTSTQESPKPPRRSLLIKMPGGLIQVVYAGVPTPFGQMRVNGIVGTMIDVPLDAGNWDDVMGFLSLCRTTFDAAIESWVAHDETIERLRTREAHK